MLNKFKKCFRISFLPLAILAIAVTLFAFKQGKEYFGMKTPVAYSLNFTVQKTSTTTYDNASGTAYENVQPITENENKSFSIQVSEGGELNMTIRDLAPTGECVVTTIHNSTMTLYNAYGGVLQQIELDANALDLASLTSMVTMADKEAVVAEIRDIQNGLAIPENDGTVIKPLGGDMVKIETSDSETVIDTNNGLVTESKIMSNGVVVAETTYNSSRDASGAYILNSTQENSYDAVPNSSARVHTTVSSNYSNFRLAKK
jgi:hypothetical protein